MTLARRPWVAVLLAAPLFLTACTSTAKPAKDALSDRLDAALDRGKTGDAHYTARVVDLSSGKELYAVDIDEPFIPASNGKIAVSAATLDFFGADHEFKTYLAIDGQDLWLIGTGDPGAGDNTIAKKSGGTTMTLLDNFAAALKKRGISRINGNLYYYDRALDDEWIHPSWSKSYITEWYAAPISGLNFNNNSIDISVKPTTEGKPVDFAVVPPTHGVKIENKCVTGQGDAPDVERKLDAPDYTIIGATTKPVDIKSEAVTNPGLFFADALRTHLNARGIPVAGQIVRAEKPLDGKLIPSPDKTVAVAETRLSDGLNRINKQSQNNFAEGYDKMLGKAWLAKQGKDEPGSWASGEQAVKAFLRDHKIDDSKVVVADGSGLSRLNRVTARMITGVLMTMWKHDDKQAFFDSLSISGEDGTIASRMKDLKGRVHAKTGYIGGVRALSGYIQTDSGKWLAFSIIYNGIDGSVKPYENRQDNAVRVLAAWPKEANLPATTRATTQP